jgi:hypothetical protein
MDGLTLGHPCCAHHNCHIPLTTIRDRCRITHRELNNICNIKGCSERVVEGKMLMHPRTLVMIKIYRTIPRWWTPIWFNSKAESYTK